MALRVDRETALGWLGIEGFRPSGRVRPARLQSPADGEEPISDAPVEARAAPQTDPNETPMDASADVPTPVPDGADDERPRQEPVAAAEAAPTPAPAEPADEVLTDRLCLAADSPHRVLAEAIAQIAGLACESGEGGDTVTVRGETWELASLAGDGSAKRRLWRALVARGRRARG
ncbi:hypothetical protein D5687_05465 [Guyparkeria sp. SCN-R1]|uniref:hypothetical protein n=1 Tax=Guyparkeria sp. SCN-R1 TaxID=2341113 RepID=UPI000F646479|nr:hypothetical protein [Guyparkeria sp. SCN-R1]RRQ23715.1 hypothetical protein D5687_05465 [Guyparkeria sp. SCN-R1]